MKTVSKVFGALALSFGMTATCAGETVFIVNRVIDREDSNPGDGHCIGKNLIASPQAPGVCSLRAAINEVNALSQLPGYGSEQFTIKVRPGVYQLTALGNEVHQEIHDSTGLLNDLDVIARNFRLMGISASGGTPEAQHRAVIRASSDTINGFRIFDLNVNDHHAEFEFSDIVLTQGLGRGKKGGAAIACRGGGRVKIRRTRISSNVVTTSDSPVWAAGAINSACDLDVETSAISNNSGSAVVLQSNFSQGLSLTMAKSSVTDNGQVGLLLVPTAHLDCSSAFCDDTNYYDVGASISASTIARNATGISSTHGATVVVNSSTIMNNARGIHFVDSFWYLHAGPPENEDHYYYGSGSDLQSFTLANSIVANSSSADLEQGQQYSNVIYHYQSLGHNYIDKIVGAPNFQGTGDLSGFGPLSGVTSVYANAYTAAMLPPEDSMLIQAGSEVPIGQQGACTQFDQAGNSRGFRCDIGALEQDAELNFPPLTPPADPGDPEELPPGLPPDSDPQDPQVFKDGFDI